MKNFTKKPCPTKLLKINYYQAEPNGGSNMPSAYFVRGLATILVKLALHFINHDAMATGCNSIVRSLKLVKAGSASQRPKHSSCFTKCIISFWNRRAPTIESIVL
jgi:hypothetical protein